MGRTGVDGFGVPVAAGTAGPGERVAAGTAAAVGLGGVDSCSSFGFCRDALRHRFLAGDSSSLLTRIDIAVKRRCVF